VWDFRSTVIVAQTLPRLTRPRGPRTVWKEERATTRVVTVSVPPEHMLKRPCPPLGTPPCGADGRSAQPATTATTRARVTGSSQWALDCMIRMAETTSSITVTETISEGSPSCASPEYTSPVHVVTIASRAL